jgi:hypothetical protein
MDLFLRHAEQIMETAVAGSATSEYLISLSRSGVVRMLSEAEGWSLSALAAEYGSAAVYRVRRLRKTVQVEGWAAGRTCKLDRKLSGPLESGYATLLPLEVGTGSVKALSPHVWNS